MMKYDGGPAVIVTKLHEPAELIIRKRLIVMKACVKFIYFTQYYNYILETYTNISTTPYN